MACFLNDAEPIIRAACAKSRSGRTIQTLVFLHFEAMMKFPLLLLCCTLLAGFMSAPNAQTPIYLYQTVNPEECALAETGPVERREPYSFTGKVREIDPQVYECAVEIPIGEFQNKLGYCVMRGHNYSAGYEFFKGKPGTRRHSCDARPLANGSFYFQATGIDQDSCDWLCFQGSNK